MHISKIAVAACSAVLFSAAITSVPRAETNWDALGSAGWSAGSGDAQKVADAGAAAGAGTDVGTGGDWSVAIQRAFVELGMAEPRAACYGNVLVKNLSPQEQQAAAQLVDQAETAAEVKTGVLSGGPEMVGGFSAASVSCPESMGG